MLVMTKDKGSVWRLDRDDFVKAEIDRRENGYNVFAYIRNLDAQEGRLKKKCWFGACNSRERAEEVLKNLMVALAEDKFVIIEDETEEEKES